MGFNAVLASATAARNFIARRQIDKRVSFLSYFSDLVGDVSSYHCVPSTPITAGMLTPHSSYQLLSGATNIHYVLPGLDLSGAFTIEGEAYHAYDYNTYSFTISGHILLCCGKYGCSLGDNVTASPQLNTGYQNGYDHLCVTRTAAGVLTSYKNGVRIDYVTGDTTNWGANKTLIINTNTNYAWRYLRIISGVCLGNGGANYPVPAEKLTGFETLG